MTSLELFPINRFWRYAGERVIAEHSRLRLEPDGGLMDSIKKHCITIELELPLEKFDDFGGGAQIETTREDGYGKPLTYTHAEDLTVAFQKQSRHGLSNWNASLLAWLKGLPKDYEIILYWS